MPVYAFSGFVPVVHPTAFVHPTATLIGDAIVGAHCYVGPGASMRGDFGRVELRAGANLQDNCVMHSFPGRTALVEEDGHIGHGAILHGCLVGRGALIGINAVVMDNVVVGENSFVAAMSFVKEGMQVPPNTLVAGSPARIIRELGETEIGWKANGTRLYQQLAAESIAQMREVQPLAAVEPDRPRREAGSKPLGEVKRGQ